MDLWLRWISKFCHAAVNLGQGLAPPHFLHGSPRNADDEYPVVCVQGRDIHTTRGLMGVTAKKLPYLFAVHNFPHALVSRFVLKSRKFQKVDRTAGRRW